MTVRPSRAAAVASLLLLCVASACGPEGQSGEPPAVSTAAVTTVGARVLYDDALVNGWVDWSWAPHNLANTSPVAVGARSIAVTYGAWQGLYLHAPGTATASYVSLDFRVNGGASANPAVGAYVSVSGVQKPRVAIAPYCDGGAIPANAWTRCHVPLSALGAANATLDGVVLQEAAGTSHPTMYFDQIQLSPALPPAPSGVVATATATSVSLAWTADPAATGGYHVYRAPAQAGPFTRLDTAAVTSASYVDAAVTAGTTYWYAVSSEDAAGEGPRSTPVSATVPASSGSGGGTTGGTTGTGTGSGSTSTTVSQYVYRDALVSPWVDWSWCTRNLANPSPVAAGTASIAASFGAWQGLYLHTAGLSTSGLAAFTLAVNGGTGGGGAALTVKTVDPSGNLSAGTPLGPTCAAGGVVANAWTTCTVPLSAIAPAGATITGIVLQEAKGGTIPTIYLDELGFTSSGSSGGTTTPPAVAVSLSPTAAALTYGGTQQFTAAVTGATNTGVTWTVQEGAAGGAISSTGLYTAPSAAGTYHVVATSAADPTRSAVATVTVSAPTSGSSGVSMTGLHVMGHQIQNGNGQEVRIHGVNRSGSEYACVQGYGFFDGPADAASIQAIKSWKVNAIRIPLNEDCWLGINGAPAAYSGAAYRTAIANYVSLVTGAGLAAIVDLHWSAPGTSLASSQQPMADRDHAPTFWAQVAAAFKGNSSVIFELYNEPYPDSNQDTAAAWACWQSGGTCPGVPFVAAGMQELLDAVRGTGATNVVLLGGVQYSNSLTGWLAHKPTDATGNLAAAWHVYNFNICSTTGCYDTNAGPVLSSVPVVATEIGEDDCQGGWTSTLTGWLDAHGGSYVPWTWNTWGTCLSLITAYDGTPKAPYGQTYHDHLSALP